MNQYHRKAMNDRHQRPSYPLRMSDELRTALEDEAKKGNRSLHAEIIKRLETSLKLPEHLDGLEEAFNVVSEGYDKADGLVRNMLKLYEIQKTLSDQQQDVIDNLLRALPDLSGENGQDQEKQSKAPAQPRKPHMQLTDPVDQIRAAYEEVKPRGPATPTIPGVNAPKRGLGSKPKTSKKTPT